MTLMMLRICRRCYAAVFALAILVLVSPAVAGSYLDRAGLLVWQGQDDADFLRARVSDRELARVIHEVAQARVKAAGGMVVPKEVVQAHPHVLLILENYERAADAAVSGDTQRFLVHQQRARDETRTLQGVLKQLGWSLPEPRGRSRR